MEFLEIDNDEFEQFAINHEQISFHQCREWAELKKVNGWDCFYVCVKEKKKIIAASLLLCKNTPIKKKIFYAPRGFLIDYENKELLEFFTENIKNFVKKNNGFFIKIDPYVLYQQRDKFGNIIENGINHKIAVENLKKLGYHHKGFQVDYSSLQPRFIFWLPLKNKTVDDVWENFSKDTKRHINKTKKELLVLEEVNKDNIDDFCKIMEHTSKRRGFIDRPKSYYLKMLEVFKDNIKILSAVLYTDNALNYWKTEEEKLKVEKKEKEKIVNETNSKKSKDALRDVSKNLEEVQNTIKELKELEKTYGKRIVMASSMFLLYGKEVLYLFSGSFDQFMKYNAQYLIQWEMIQYAINNNYERYNFYGIEGIFDESNGVYEFKKGFDGEVVEFIGEFDLIVDKKTYYLYKIGFGSYKKIKHILFKLKGGK